MSRLIERLRELGWEDGRIADLTIAGLAEVRTDAADNRMVDRFLELRRLYGGRFTARDRAFVLIEGEPVGVETLPTILRDIRMTRRSVEANGEMCRMLLKARLEEPAPVG
jgi:hypothetical protein